MKNTKTGNITVAIFWLIATILRILSAFAGANNIFLIGVCVANLLITILLFVKNKGNILFFALGGRALLGLIYACVEYHIINLMVAMSFVILLVFYMPLSDQIIVINGMRPIKKFAKEAYYLPAVVLLLSNITNQVFSLAYYVNADIITVVATIIVGLPEVAAVFYFEKWLRDSDNIRKTNVDALQNECGDDENDSLVDEICVDDAEKESNKKLRLVGLASIALCIIILFVGTFGIDGLFLNQDEEIAYQNALYMQKKLSDRDSFRLYDQMYVFRHYNSNGQNDCTYTVFESGGANSYGAIVSEMVVFKNGEYYSTYRSLGNNIYSSTEELMEKFDLEQCMEGDGEWLGYTTTVVDANKILKKMGIK